MFRKVLLFITTLIVISAAGTYYLNARYLPGPGRRLIQQKLQERVRADISFSSVHFAPLKGFIVRDLRVRDARHPDKTVFSADEIYFHVLVIPLWRGQKVIIPRLNAINPTLALARSSDGAWNLSRIVTPSAPTVSSRPTRFTLAGIRIHNGRIVFSDYGSRQPFLADIRQISLSAGMDGAGRYRFRLSARKNAASKTEVHAQGIASPASRSAAGQLRWTNLQPQNIVRSYYPGDNVLINPDVLTDGTGTFRYSSGTWRFNGHIQSRRLETTVNGFTFRGSPSLDISAAYRPDNPSRWQFKGAIEMDGASLDNLPRFDVVDNLRGRILIQPDFFKTEGLSGHLGKELPLTLSGHIRRSDASWQAKLTARGKAGLSTLYPYWPELRPLTGDDPTGNVEVSLTYRGNLLSWDMAALTGSLVLSDAALSGPSLPLPLTGLTGTLRLDRGKLAWDDVKGLINESPFESRGTLSDITDPKTRIRLTVRQFDCSLLPSVFPVVFETHHIALQGRSDITVSYNGPVRRPDPSALDIEATLNGVTLRGGPINETFSNLEGVLTYRDRHLKWRDIRGVFRREPLRTDGSLTISDQPIVHASLLWRDLNLETQFRWRQPTITVNFAKGKIFSSVFTLKGQVHTGGPDPVFDLTGQFNLRLEDLPSLLPRHEAIFKRFNPEGVLGINGSVRGQIGTPRDWDIRINGRSEQLSLDAYTLEQLDLKFNRAGRVIEQAHLTANAYGGDITVNADEDATLSDGRFRLRLTARDIDLAKLKADTIWKDNLVAGMFGLSFEGTTSWEKLDDIQGEGSVHIREGRIWEMSLFKGLGQFLFIPEFKNIIFRQADGTFVVKKKKVYTDDLTLKSDAVNLLCRGWVDFKGRLSFGIFSHFSRQTIAKSASLKKLVTAALTSPDDYLTIRLTGSLANPQYVVVPSSVDMLKRTTDMILEGIRDIFE